MPRRSLDDALGSSTPTPTPEPAPPPRRSSPPAAAAEPDVYKLTAILTEAEHNRLEWLTDRVLDDIAPRRVGKGWRTKVIRGLLAIAEDDPDIVRRVAQAIRDAEGRE